MRWQVHCLIGTAKAMLPFEARLRQLKRAVRPPRIGPQHESVLSGAIDHVRELRAAGLRLHGAHVLEIGSGWFPILPLVFRAAGAERVYLTDAHRLMDGATLSAAIGYVQKNRAMLADRLQLDPAGFDALAAGADDGAALDARLERLGLVYLAPFDPDRYPPVDAIVSQTVFEHIAPADLRRLLRTADAALRPGGFMSHGIDNSDHRTIHDPSLTRFDFLRFSPGVWRWLCLDPQAYTNRLRHSDYADMLRRAGHELVHEGKWVDEPAAGAFARTPPHPVFHGKSPVDLATSWSHFVTRRPDLAIAAEAPPVDVSIVIPTLNGNEHLAQQLHSLIDQQTRYSYEIVVADNGSTDDTRAIVAEIARRTQGRPVVRLVDAPVPGVNAARNAGWRAARAEKILFCDHDDLAAPGYIDAMAAALDEADGAAGMLEFARLNPALAATPLRSALANEAGMPVPIGAASGWRLAMLKRLGGFDASFRHGCDDIEIAIRAARLGARIAEVPAAIIHKREIGSRLQALRRFYRYGRSRPRLIRNFAEAEHRSTREALRHWRWVLGRILRGQTDLATAQNAGRNLGRLVGSIQHRIWAP